MIKFVYEGPMRVGFDLLGRELGPGEEFEVPPEIALRFDNHGHCRCLEPEKLAPLRDAELAEQKAQDDARAAAGLVNAHPDAQKAAAERAAAAHAQAPPPAVAPAIDQPAPISDPAPAAAKRAKTAVADPAPTATVK